LPDASANDLAGPYSMHPVGQEDAEWVTTLGKQWGDMAIYACDFKEELGQWRQH